MARRVREDSPGQLFFSYASPIAIPQGDGTFVVKPGKLTVRQDGDAVGPKEFARMQGCSRSSVYRFMDEGLIPAEYVERRTPRRIRIRLAALEALRKAIDRQDPLRN
jgi:predicted DNA-binding transcriptional regulator AlpA